MKVIMPMAGLGSRFATAGITKPKPLIEVKGKEMVKWATDSIPFVDYSDFIFVVREAHVDEYKIDELLRKFFGSDIDIVVIDYLTKGPAATAALGGQYVDDDEAIIIADSDMYFQSEEYNELLEDAPEDVHGAIPVFESTDDSNSYSKLGENNRITRVAEKERISNYANIGAYYFSRFESFEWALERTREEKITVNDEYYVAPCYNELIDRGETVVACECDTVWGLGTPEEVERFEEEFEAP